MNFEKLLRLAYDGALWLWSDANEHYNQNPNKINEQILDDKWVDLKEISELRLEHERETKCKSTNENDAKYKYMIRVYPLDESVKPQTMFYQHSETAYRAFAKGSIAIQCCQVKSNIFLYERLNDGRWYQLKVTTAPQAQQTEAQQAQPVGGYAVHVVHNNGKTQDLNFESIKAVEATVEMLKFYLKSELIETVVVFKKITPAHYETIKIIRREDV